MTAFLFLANISLIKIRFFMKHLISALLFFFTAGLSAQPHEQPKLRVTSGFFSNHCELGDQDVSEKEVALHLQKTSPESYYNWKRYQSLNRQSTIWGAVTAITAAGLLTNLFAKNNYVAGSVALVTLVGASFEIGTLIGAHSKQEKAIKSYNRQFGY
jgi:uncharacterized membrane protein YkgB